MTKEEFEGMFTVIHKYDYTPDGQWTDIATENWVVESTARIINSLPKRDWVYVPWYNYPLRMIWI